MQKSHVNTCFRINAKRRHGSTQFYLEISFYAIQAALRHGCRELSKHKAKIDKINTQCSLAKLAVNYHIT